MLLHNHLVQVRENKKVQEVLIFNIGHTSQLEVFESTPLSNTADLKKVESLGSSMSIPVLLDDGSSS